MQAHDRSSALNDQQPYLKSEVQITADRVINGPKHPKEPRETYSRAPVWVPSLRRGEPGGVEPHQRGEGLRHPVGDHRHGAQHDPDLQQRHRHLCALLGLDLILLHYSTHSAEKAGVAVPRASSRLDRDSGSARLLVHISRGSACRRLGRGEGDRNEKGRDRDGTAAQGLTQWRTKGKKRILLLFLSVCLLFSLSRSLLPLQLLVLSAPRPTVRLLPWCAQ